MILNTQLIIDVHAHVFPEKIASRAVKAIGDFYDLPMQEDGTIERLLECGKEARISHFVIHSVATRPDQAHSINDFIAAGIRKAPNLIGFGTVHPYMEDLQAEVERIQALGLRGIKIHPDFQCFDIDDEKALALYRMIEGKLPILIHMGDKTRTYSSPLKLHKVLQRFPDLQAIGAHFGGYSAWQESEKWLVGSPVYFDTSSSLFALAPEQAEEIIRTHGAEKVLFGTDYPMWNCAEEMQRFNALKLSQEQRKLILYENSAKLLQL